ncbi:MAG: hypothetical protein P4L83_02440 [Nevskia sp.]|nr:hypothetical protein [Nevskia sp.]
MTWMFHWLSDLLSWCLILGGIALVLIAAISKPLAALWPPLALVHGVFACIARLLGVALILVGCGRLWLAQHDAGIVAQWQAAQTAAVASAREQEHASAMAALEAAQQDAAARVRTVTVIKREIAHVPASTGCVRSPAISAALDGLRRPAGGRAGSPAGGAPVPDDLHGRAGTPGAAPGR